MKMARVELMYYSFVIFGVARGLVVDSNRTHNGIETMDDALTIKILKICDKILDTFVDMTPQAIGEAASNYCETSSQNYKPEDLAEIKKRFEDYGNNVQDWNLCPEEGENNKGQQIVKLTMQAYKKKLSKFIECKSTSSLRDKIKLEGWGYNMFVGEQHDICDDVGQDLYNVGLEKENGIAPEGVYLTALPGMEWKFRKTNRAMKECILIPIQRHACKESAYEVVMTVLHETHHKICKSDDNPVGTLKTETIYGKDEICKYLRDEPKRKKDLFAVPDIFAYIVAAAASTEASLGTDLGTDILVDKNGYWEQFY